MGLIQFFGLDKLATLGRMVRSHGGVLASLRHIYVTDDLKEGTLVGEDKFGNKYFQNDKYFYGRNRWVSRRETGLAAKLGLGKECQKVVVLHQKVGGQKVNRVWHQ